MSFGKRRYDRLVAHDSVVDGKPYREYHARFLSLNLGEEGEQLTEAELRQQLDDNGRRVPFPLPDGEEKLALAALVAQAKGKTSSRARITAQAERGAQTSLLDPLQPPERAVVERWRRRTTLKITTTTENELESYNDLSRAVLALVDTYLPKPKGT